MIRPEANWHSGCFNELCLKIGRKVTWGWNWEEAPKFGAGFRKRHLKRTRESLEFPQKTAIFQCAIHEWDIDEARGKALNKPSHLLGRARKTTS